MSTPPATAAPEAVAPPPRSLAEDLRSRDDAQLTALIAARPDLARPAPADLTTLAARALTPAGLRQVLDSLDTARLRTLEAAVVAAEPITAEDVAALLGCAAERAAQLLEGLYDLALLWRTTGGYAAPRAVRDALGPVAGLAPADPRDATITDPAGLLDALTSQAPAGAREVLDRLTWGPPTGVVDLRGAVGPAVRWLVDHTLLRGSDDGGSVTLPRPIALALRDGRLHRTPDLDPPATRSRILRPEDVDAGAGSVAGELLACVEAVATAWGDSPPRVLRTGGLAVRDLARTVALTGLDTHGTALVLEVVSAAGLIGPDGGLDPVWAPTRRYDTWAEQEDDMRWAELVLAWRDMPRAPHRIGTRGVDGTINAFTDGVTWGSLPLLRRRTLGVLIALEPGTTIEADDVVARLRWEVPRRDPAVVEEAALATTSEAALLGLTSAGAATSSLRDLCREEASVDSVAAAARLPEAVDHVILQADLTAVAPGRLSRSSAAFMRTAADVESRGAAVVYRFGADSIRRLFDAGWTVEDVLGTLARMSTTPVPQPLEYLVGDAWRSHGRARVGAASTYVRSDDVIALDALMRRPEASSARLRRLAPTVLVSDLAPTRLLALLRDWGIHALAEGADGTVVGAGTAPARAPDPRRRPTVTPALDVDAVVAGLRRGESTRTAASNGATAGARASETGESAGQTGTAGTIGTTGTAGSTRTTGATSPNGSTTPAGSTHGQITSAAPSIPATDPAVTLAVLRHAAAEQTDVWVGVADTGGRITHRHVRPTRISGGLAHGIDLATGRVEAWPVSRIAGVASPDADSF